MTPDKMYLRTTFDQDALLYDQARPGYPESLFDDMVMLSGLQACPKQKTVAKSAA